MNIALPLVALAVVVGAARPAPAGEVPVSEDALVAAARRLETSVVEVRVGRGVARLFLESARSSLEAAGRALAVDPREDLKAHPWKLLDVDRSRQAGTARAFFVGDGLLLTASAAVEGAGKVEVVASDGRTAEAVVAGLDRDFGLAVLRTSLAGAVLEVDGASELEPGRLLLAPTAPGGGVELLVVPTRETGPTARGLARLPRDASGGAIGSPTLGPDGRVRGILVARGVQVGSDAARGVLYSLGSGGSDVPFVAGLLPPQQGQGGAAYLVERDGRLLQATSATGVATATHVLPGRRIARALDGLRRDGRVSKAYLGIVLGAPEAKGSPIDERRVARLLPGSPAEGRLRAGDRIVAVAGRRLEAHDDVSYEILALEPGKPATVTVERELEQEPPAVETVQVEVVPGVRTDDANARGSAVFGFEAVPLTPELKAWLRVAEDGLVVSEVAVGGAAERGGLRRGDRLARVVGRDVASPADLSAAVDDALRRLAAGEAVTVEVVREGQATTLRLLGESPPSRPK